MIPGKLKLYATLTLTLWLAFSGVAAAEQLYVNESGWWRDGGAFNASTAPIQTAVGAAGAGDAIFVHGGNYYENVDVDKEGLTLVGAGADVVTVSASSADEHVFEATANGVNISGFTVTSATGDGMAGIHINDADHCNVYKNNASNNENGIVLQYSSNNTISANVANSNDNRGILVRSSSNCNRISNNTMNSNTRRGISMDYSNSNKLSNNTALENEIGIGMWNSTSNTLTNNTASDNTNLCIYLYNSSGNTLSNNVANSNNAADNSNNYHGIELDSSSNNTLTNNTAKSNNHYGISLYNSSNNILRSNIASNNGDHGISLYNSSNSNTVSDNTANSNDDHGIRLYDSNSNTLTNNTANLNNRGIYLHNANNNIIACNWVQNNTQAGVHLYSGSTGNDISYNNIITNGKYNVASGGWAWQFYNEQSTPVEAKHNYWGAEMNNSTIDASIHDDEEGWGEVEYYPFETELVPCAPSPEAPHTFTTADATIALQIAAGSHPHDLRWDVSGDKRVTSLDVLMILQAAAHAIDL